MGVRAALRELKSLVGLFFEYVGTSVFRVNYFSTIPKDKGV